MPALRPARVHRARGRSALWIPLLSLLVAGALGVFTPAPVPTHRAIPARDLLALDPRGDGRAAKVVGHLRAARRVAVFVPGADITLSNFERGHGTSSPVTKARRLHREMHRLDPELPSAVVAWLGYDTPEGIGVAAIRSERAEEGARALVHLVDRLDTERRDVTVICHSYGSVVCGLAAPRLRATDIVVIGSPGMDVRSGEELGTSATVWAASAPGDWTRFVPPVRVLGAGHGANPVSEGFGARVFATGDVRGHDHYFTPGSVSLANIARISLGHYRRVTRIEPFPSLIWDIVGVIWDRLSQLFVARLPPRDLLN